MTGGFRYHLLDLTFELIQTWEVFIDFCKIAENWVSLFNTCREKPSLNGQIQNLNLCLHVAFWWFSIHTVFVFYFSISAFCPLDTILDTDLQKHSVDGFHTCQNSIFLNKMHKSHFLSLKHFVLFEIGFSNTALFPSHTFSFNLSPLPCLARALPLIAIILLLLPIRILFFTLYS